MPKGVDTANHPGRVVNRESWRGLDQMHPPQHFASVEDTIPAYGGRAMIGNAYSAGPFSTPSRAEHASRALANRVQRTGGSDRHFITGDLYRRV
jgi:hypothetical protein